jgi:hypothetical protein
VPLLEPRWTSLKRTWRPETAAGREPLPLKGIPALPGYYLYYPSRRQASPAFALIQLKTRSMVLKRSSKMAGSNNGLRPRFGLLRPRGLGLILGVMPH